jgi:hypothetical protein
MKNRIRIQQSQRQKNTFRYSIAALSIVGIIGGLGSFTLLNLGSQEKAQAASLQTESDNVISTKVNSFTATATGSHVLLKWTSSNETLNEFYTIERSMDNTEWETIGREAASQSNNPENSYTFMDRDVAGEHSYYRISYTRFDGKREYAQQLDVKHENAMAALNTEQLWVDNSIFTDGFNIKFDAKQDANGELKIFDATGKIVDVQQYTLQKGKQIIKYEQSSLKSGLHMAVFEVPGDKSYSARLVKI